MSDQEDDYQRAAGPIPVEPIVNPPLNHAQINFARDIVQRNHPLKTAHITAVWPFLNIFSCCLPRRKKNFNVALKQALRHKLDMKMPHSEVSIEENPFLLLGFGMNAYFDLVKQLCQMMLFIAIFSVPTCWVFSQYEGLNQLPNYTYTQYSLGNLGGAHTACGQAPLNIPKASINLACNSGSLDQFARTEKDDAPAVSVGIINKSQKKTNYCMTSGFEKPDEYNCSQYLDSSALLTDLEASQGETSVIIRDLARYFLDTPSAEVQEECFGSSTMAFVQLACTLTSEELHVRQIQGLMVGCIACAITLFIMIYTDYIRQVAKSNFVEWDVKTVTAGDYSIEFDISPAFYAKFANDFGPQKDDRSPMARFFRDWITEEMEKRLSGEDDLGYEDEPIDQIRIAVTTFAFDNANLIGLLRERGTYIRTEKWDKMREIDDKVNLVKDDPALFKKLTTPCSVFMTFENEEGYQRALAYKSTETEGPKKKWLGEFEIEIQEASEPSDIIWENRHFTPTQRFRKTIVVWIIISLALFASFCVIFQGKKFQVNVTQKFPIVNCAPYYETYQDQLINFALADYTTNKALEEQGQTISYAGYLQCFCQKQKANEALATEVYGNDELPICKEYSTYTYVALAIGQAITVFIVVVNKILVKICVALITWVGFDTHSEQLTKITNGVFVAQFFNTAIILLLVNANFSEVFTPLSGTFNGPFPDYVPYWYASVGYAVTDTMILNAFFPIIFQVMDDTIAWLMLKLDNGWSNDVYKTKKTQVSQYVALHSGPQYIVHFKYSTVFNVTFVTLMYGVGMPILFPVAILNYVIFWCLERYHMAYTYQLPPSLDDKLTKNAVSILKFAPILFLFNGYWMLSNRQMFEGVLNLRQSLDDVMVTGHDFSSIYKVNQAIPALLIAVAVLIIFLLQKCFKKQLKKWGFGFSKNKIQVDENLPYFFDAIKLSEADWIVKENDYYDKTYRMPFISQELQDKCDNTKIAKKPIQGIHWYNLLSNPRYVQDFAYIPVDTPNRDEMIVDDDDNEDNDCEQSDMVQLILNMAYIEDSLVKDLTFGAGISKVIKGHNLGAAVLMEAFKKSKQVEEE